MGQGPFCSSLTLAQPACPTLEGMQAEGEVRLLWFVPLVIPHSWNVGMNNWIELSPEIKLAI